MEKLFLDTEFNGFGGDLLSMAIVDSQDNQFYECLSYEETLTAWVKENVKLDKAPVEKAVFQEKLQTFLGNYTRGFCIVADWPEDIRHFMDVLITSPGTMMALPMFQTIICREVHSQGSKVPHHALHDAIAVREAWFALQE